MHLQGAAMQQMGGTTDDEGRQQSNSRNNHSRMPSLPSSIKGSIGVTGPANMNNGQNSKQRQVHPGMPLNIAANDITFAGTYNQIRKFGN
mmetsp:Transcript_5104/g.7773  ORF Transcript_5104/g.7773 Transcript_5104/m.7773 type:complete len:90 (-) Transcript_5104:2106-2375(-)